MFDRLSERWRRALIGAVAVHLILALFIGVSLSSKPTPNQLAVQPQKEVVQAVAIDEQRILKEMERRSSLEQAKVRKAEASKERLERDAARAKKLRKQEERKMAALKEKRRAELAKKKREKALAEKRAKEARAQEQQRVAKLKEQQKRAEEERLQQLEDARIAAQKAAFEKSLAEEQSRLQQEANRVQQRKLALEKNRYVALIREKVVRNWVKPSGTNPGDSCKVLVHQIPGGDVIDVKVTACSGSVAFRNSVERAVFRASPLPTPATKELFDREIEFTFTP